MFKIDGQDSFTLADMLASNADDVELCAWLKSAKVGDVFSDVTHVECVGKAA